MQAHMYELVFIAGTCRCGDPADKWKGASGRHKRKPVPDK